jgi:hypothetical protein
LILAEVLGTLAQQVGGAAYVNTLFSPLEMLCCVEDLAVRQKVYFFFNLLLFLGYSITNTFNISSNNNISGSAWYRTSSSFIQQ